MAGAAMANKFVGREKEIKSLERVVANKHASIVIIHGRRRVGKTTLIEHVFEKRNLLKIEGVEGGNKQRQLTTALLMAAAHFKDPNIAKLNFTRWLEFFELIGKYLARGTHTLYLEELQWLASYNDELVADLKNAWDNIFSKNPKLILILCGSSPSFMVNHVVKSKALYGRVQAETNLQPFELKKIWHFIGARTTHLTQMDAYLTVGGMPEYLRQLSKGTSMLTTLCEQAFRQDGYFFSEYERIFVSSLARNPDYKNIVKLLAKRKFATRPELAGLLDTNSGGTLTNLLAELELSGFIHSYTPFDREQGSKLTRYEISDCYLQFYYRFIEPKKKQILQRTFDSNPTKALNIAHYQQWLGYSFERWCRGQHAALAELLGFSAVHYDVGPYFSRKTGNDFQVDLVFDRADRVKTVCEIKYTRSPVDRSVIAEFERKETFLVDKRHSIQRVLISASGCDRSVANAGFFDEIIDLERLFD